MEGLGLMLQKEAELQTLTLEVLKSSGIEGEKLDAAQVRSSIARRLGSETGGLRPSATSRALSGSLDATRNYAEPLSDERLFAWHAASFPTGRSGCANHRGRVAQRWSRADAGRLQSRWKREGAL
jgi:hypothetical protein